MNIILLIFLLLALLLLFFCLINCEEKAGRKHILLGFLIISSFIGLRLIIRLPLKIDFNSVLLLILAISIVSIYCSILLMEVINLEKIKSRAFLNNKYLKKLLIWLLKQKNNIFESLNFIYIQLLKLFPTYADTLFDVFFWFVNINQKYLMHIILLVFDYLPKLILLIACMLDILIFHEFCYFYKFFWVILISFGFHVIIYILHDVAEKAFNELKQHVQVILKDVKIQNHLLINYSCEYKNLIENYTLEELDLMFITYFKMQIAYGYLIFLKKTIKFKILNHLLAYGYIITWGYLIIRTIYNLF